MAIIDRYMLRSFFFNLILWSFCLVGIYVVFDLFTNLDTLLEVGKATGSVTKTLCTYYTFQAIPKVMGLSSILGLISAMITISMMMRHNEVIPLQAAGISTMRIVAPLIAAALLVSGLSILCRECVLPRYIDKLSLEPKDYQNEQGIKVNATQDRQTGVSIQGDMLYRTERNITDPVFTFQPPVVKEMSPCEQKTRFFTPPQKTRQPVFCSRVLTLVPLCFPRHRSFFRKKSCC